MAPSEDMNNILVRLMEKGVEIPSPSNVEIYRKIAGKNASEKTIQGKQEFREQWSAIEDSFMKAFDLEGELQIRGRFLEYIDDAMKTGEKDYVSVIKGMDGIQAEAGVLWLQGLVTRINREVFSLLPGLNIN